MRASERLYALDALRGFAAVAVVLFHWQFWGQDPQVRMLWPMPSRRSSSNAESRRWACLDLVGLHLLLAVQERNSGPFHRRPLVLRRSVFSRLYPLYFLTLVWAWGGHDLYAWMNQGSNWSSGVNDLTGVPEAVAFVFPLWTPRRVIGFNLPAWSLAVEALMYLLFFILARRSLLGLAGTLVMLRYWRCPCSWYSADIAYGMTSFFMGGMCWLAFERIDGVWPGARATPGRALLLAGDARVRVRHRQLVADAAGIPGPLLRHVRAVSCDSAVPGFARDAQGPDRARCSLVRRLHVRDLSAALSADVDDGDPVPRDRWGATSRRSSRR